MIKDSSIASDFRGDINGLRAWAVLAVILYHFGIPGFGGGFVGVDVFFVISGFLMTGIVVAGLERGGFSLAAFYMARARRILPALIVLCMVLLAFGWRGLLPRDYKTLGHDAVYSLLFFSNIKFWHEAGYFDTASHEKWLLHTWSLAVEWQFYLLLPLVLLAVWKLRPSRQLILVLMGLGFIASLTFSVLTTFWQPAAAFYLLHPRAWEMLAGGLVYLLASRRTFTAFQGSTFEAAGLALVIGAIAGFDASSSWPSWRAVVPVAGAMGVLLASQTGSRWTGNPVAQWLGTRSYSLYLWHWPIVVALTYLERQTDPQAIAAGLVLTLALGQLSYLLVEIPARVYLSQHGLGRGAVALLYMTVALVMLGSLIRLRDGVTDRFPASLDRISYESENVKPRREECMTKGGTTSPSCMYGGDQLRAILIGDSHADAVTTALAAAVPNLHDGIMDWSYSSCPTLLGVKNLSPKFRADEKCGEFLQWALTKLDKVPRDVPLVIVNRSTVYALGHNELWEHDANIPSVYFSQPYTTAAPAFLAEFAQHLTDTACQLAKDRTVYLMRPIPEMGIDVPKVMARSMAWGYSRDISISLVDYHQRHVVVWAAQNAAQERCGVKILDPLPYLCPDGRCHGTKNGRPLYYDDDHLSEYGNKLLVPMFSQVFQPQGQSVARQGHSRIVFPD